MRCLGILTTLLCCIAMQSLAEKILVLHPVYAGSHIRAVRSILEQMTQRGYEVGIKYEIYILFETF